jgi:hypothetical protein
MVRMQQMHHNRRALRDARAKGPCVFAGRGCDIDDSYASISLRKRAEMPVRAPASARTISLGARQTQRISPAQGKLSARSAPACTIYKSIMSRRVTPECGL